MTDRNPAMSLLLVSFLALFYELALIRWIPANVLSIAYFSNIVLISCFLGFGLGCLMAGRRILFEIFPPALLLVCLAFIYFRRVEVVVPVHGNEWVWSGYRSNKLDILKLELGVVHALILVFLLNVMLFIPLGQMLGRLMEKFPPVKAYTINILGSLLGVVVFGALSKAGGVFGSPVAWFLVGAAVTLWFFAGRRAWLILSAISLTLVCLLVWQNSRRQVWSPYYSIQEQPRPNGEFILYVNNFLHQRSINFETNPRARDLYGLPYRLYTPERLLILGAGTGNDVAVAQSYGAREIDAVEIDPVIAGLGRARHPARPYAKPGVNVVVDDARSFLRRTRKKYDMIVFGTLDSHSLLSGKSTVRLENFVYTRECLEDVRRRLTDDGVVVLMFSVPMKWIGEKLIRMTASVFPEPHFIYHDKDRFLFNLMILAGPGLPKRLDQDALVRPLLTKAAPGAGATASVPTPPLGASPSVAAPGAGATASVPTDDWPYLYLQRRRIPAYYLHTLAIIAALAALSVRLILPRGGRTPAPQFFVLGAAFMLLETKSVTTLSMIFGSTWTVNVFVFGSVLLMIFLANLLVLRFEFKNLAGVYLCLGISLLANYAISPAAFLGRATWAQSLFPALLIATPLFFAGIIFAGLFNRVSNPAAALGANLLGSVLGGCLEYTSMILGLNNLYLVAGAFYIASFAILIRKPQTP